MSKVLALKYRPKRFEDLIGQDSISKTLSLALDSNRLSHAYLFSGLRGSGKTSTARIFSKALVCDNGPTSKPCEKCENCKMANNGNHIDIIEMDAASSRKIDDIRELIEHTKYKPNSARFKIFIIDEVHMLTKEAFNALLKTLEEPPEFVKFILATTDPLKLPATILSRTQHFRFKKISKQDVINHLSYILNIENIPYEIEALDILSRSGGGSLRDTLTLLDQAILYSNNNIDAKNVASMLGLIDPEYMDEIFQAIFESDKKKCIQIAKDLDKYECEAVIDEMIEYVKEKFFGSNEHFTTIITERFFRIFSESKQLLFLNAGNDFVLTLMLFKMIEANSLQDIDQMIATLKGEIKLTDNKSKTEEIKNKIDTDENSLQVKKDPFKQLIDKIYDRNYELGECFEKNIEFESYNDNKLTWISKSDEKCKDKLKNNYSIIKNFVYEIYGFGTKIVGKKLQTNTENESKQNTSVNEADQINNDTIDEVMHSSSCATVGFCENKKEIEKGEILNEPIVKKATELLMPTKIIVKTKI